MENSKMTREKAQKFVRYADGAKLYSMGISKKNHIDIVFATLKAVVSFHN